MIILTASSAARARSFGADEIASSSEQGRVNIEAKASIPQSKLSLTPLPIMPARAMTGTPSWHGGQFQLEPC
ncbi:hypothetical protein GGD52_004329 [Agrobacterium tumefaciens]|nr:hypothetical protein [Agrobacterium radiobacter]MBB5589703.1 hypothetical protein [Agrobacterium radiobacter]